MIYQFNSDSLIQKLFSNLKNDSQIHLTPNLDALVTIYS